MQKSWKTSDAPGTLIVSDIHAGRQNDSMRMRTLRALQRMVDHANATGIGQIILNGDMLDERAKWSAVERDMIAIRSVLKEFGGGLHNVRFVYGNHDVAAGRKVSDKDMADILGIPHVEPNWIVYDESAGITFTHGHIFGTFYARRTLRELARRGCDNMELLCTSDDFQRKLDKLQQRYVTASFLSNVLGQMGIPVETAWEAIRSWTHVARTNAAVRLRETESSATSLLASMLELSSHTLAAELGASLGSWCSLVAHTHTPAVVKRTIERHNGESVAQLVGNTGSFVSRAGFPVTCIEARFPSLILWGYDSVTHQLHRKKTVSLTPEEAAQI
jgi:UDP-2,3-diacylglucosamine pyrophosphatase LpxH